MPPPWGIFLSHNFDQGSGVGGMLSEGFVAVATRHGCLQATARGCCRAAPEAEQEGPGPGEVSIGMPPPYNLS